MPQHRTNLSPQRYNRLKEVVLDVAWEGAPFSRCTAMFAALNQGAANDARDVAALLDDLTDVQVLRKLDGDPPRWVFTGA